MPLYFVRCENRSSNIDEKYPGNPITVRYGQTCKHYSNNEKSWSDQTIICIIHINTVANTSVTC